jgi:hypothetical protein
MAVPRDSDTLDVLGNWRCVAWQGRTLPAVDGDRCVVAGELTLRADGSFSMTHLEVILGSPSARVQADFAVSSLAMREGNYDVPVKSGLPDNARPRLSLRGTRCVRRMIASSTTCTDAPGEIVEVDVVVRSGSELKVVAHETGGDVEYWFGR